MGFIKKEINKLKEGQFHNFKLSLFSLFLFLISINGFAQDSIPAAVDLSEEKELMFQQFFFKALSQKSIGNYQKSIENLENCNQILPNNSVVFFEFSKNYLELNKKLLAKEYIKRAIDQEPKNIWLQKHLVKINVAYRDFSEAIRVQKSIATINKKEREYLVRLYLKNRDFKNAIQLMEVLEDENSLSSSLKKIKDNLQQTRKARPVKSSAVSNIFKQFETDKSYVLLKQILESVKQDSDLLLDYSKKGIALFPAQPFVYLMNGKALNAKQKFNEAITSLKNGIDFVIEDDMEADFYNEMAVSYKGLGNTIEEKKYKQKSKKLKK
ncbi:hypothetical protein BXQ17_09055 [Polaribacter sp. BM10]|uniref:tetratricopeptide repeat protein n=1 Tax=Polaribacter sp. BM10 TaxID=1529069 RepID=UPI00098B35CB|nr:hypothetical protein [Polaribacter sp. BM10]AQS94200.1 hypothetical protein BXQ17_09055 [Polaribacter sp. BM10]